MSLLVIGETVGGFTPNIVVSVRNLEEHEDLARHFELSKIVESDNTLVEDILEVTVGTKPAILQKSQTKTDEGQEIEQETLFFIQPPKAVIATMSTLRNIVSVYEEILFDLVKNFELIPGSETVSTITMNS